MTKIAITRKDTGDKKLLEASEVVDYVREILGAGETEEIGWIIPITSTEKNKVVALSELAAQKCVSRKMGEGGELDQKFEASALKNLAQFCQGLLKARANDSTHFVFSPNFGEETYEGAHSLEDAALNYAYRVLPETDYRVGFIYDD